MLLVNMTAINNHTDQTVMIFTEQPESGAGHLFSPHTEQYTETPAWQLAFNTCSDTQYCQTTGEIPQYAHTFLYRAWHNHSAKSNATQCTSCKVASSSWGCCPVPRKEYHTLKPQFKIYQNCIVYRCCLQSTTRKKTRSVSINNWKEKL